MTATLICDLQFGSTGKGLIAGYLAERDNPDVCITAWMPNAGHTYINKEGRKFVHTMLANGIVSKNLKYILIGPGSALNIPSLLEELRGSCDLLGGVKVLIHPHAAVVLPRHIKEEMGLMTKIGSTKKGCGAALKDKISRNPDNMVIASSEMVINRYPELEYLVCTKEEFNSVIDNAMHIQVEGAQGYSLGINSGFYPYCTSRECTPQQIATDCGIPWHMITKVVGTMRTFPIRVANRYAADGSMIGWSGPAYPDQIELEWKNLEVEAEKTTVTKLVRRVFTWSDIQMNEAIRMCNPDEVFLNFTNYLKDEESTWELVSKINTSMRKFDNNPNKRVKYIGKGATIEDVIEI